MRLPLLGIALLITACAKKPPPKQPMAPDEEPPLTAAESNALLGIHTPDASPDDAKTGP